MAERTLIDEFLAANRFHLGELLEYRWLQRRFVRWVLITRWGPELDRGEGSAEATREDAAGRA